MKLEVIHTAELPSLVKEERFLQLPMLPVTPERALAQAENPLADPNDPALVIAWNDQDELVGFIGILRGEMLADGLPVFYNSSWWVDPLRGRMAAMPLFYKMLELTSGRLIFFELTGQTEQILRTLNGFFLAEPMHGIYAWYRSGMKYRMAGKKKKKTLPVVFGASVDMVFNLFLQIRINRWLQVNRPSGSVRLKTVHYDDPEVKQFLELYRRSHFLTRSNEEIAWIIKYPWLTDDPSVPSDRYYFSWKVFSFSIQPFALVKDDQMVGFVMISRRDGILKIPVFYVQPGTESEASMEILAWSLESGAHGWILWQKELLEAMLKSRFPFIKKSTKKKQVAWSESLGNTIPSQWKPQDGDGDSIFT